MKIESKQEKVIFHGVVNLVLCLFVAITALMLGLFGNEQVVSVYKSYNGVIYAGNEKSDKVALMINVYWGTEFINSILKVLEENQVKATFFVGKTWVETNPDLLKEIYEAGHEIGNHGSNHKEHGKLSYSQSYEEINNCTKAVFDCIGYQMNLFAPPGGSYNQATIKSAEDLKYKTILWTKDTIDWRDQDYKLIYQRATQNISSGDLVLMHPTRCTLQALQDIISTIKSKKLCLDTVSNTIKD